MISKGSLVAYKSSKLHQLYIVLTDPYESPYEDGGQVVDITDEWLGRCPINVTLLELISQ